VSTNAARTITVTVELIVLDERDGHVEGTVTADGGESVGFAGWLALLEVLERSAELGSRT
jgi:hypothetical protein